MKDVYHDKCVSKGGLNSAPKLGLNMSTSTGIKHVYQGVQRVRPQQAVTSTRGTAEH